MDLNTKGGRGKKTWAMCPECKTTKEGRYTINLYFPRGSFGYSLCKQCIYFRDLRERQLSNPREREAILFFEELDKLNPAPIPKDPNGEF